MKRIVLIGTILAAVVFCSCQPAPAPPQAPPPSLAVEPVKPIPAVVPARPELHRCIFNEGINGCRYNDLRGRKEGPDAYKWYDMQVVMLKKAR